VGFWHTGYMEFHEPTGGSGGWPASVPTPPAFPCPHCGLIFSRELDQRAHQFDGHATKRPSLVFKGRECGRTRLMVTASSVPDDWRASDVEAISVNGRFMAFAEVASFLSAARHGVHALTVQNGPMQRTFELDFCLADEADLQLVDQALQKLISNRELSLQSIDTFILRAGRGGTARRYREGLANYLYGVLHREGAQDHTELPDGSETPTYEQRYNSAVSILRSFDRPPAEAICGLVAFHYNQFMLALRKTNSHRVSEVAARFHSMMQGSPFVTASLIDRTHDSFDEALSDSVNEELLEVCAMPIDGSSLGALNRLLPAINVLRPTDQFKVRLVAAEALLAAGDAVGARRHSEALRHSGPATDWYARFRARMQEVGL
jgi:hypothetical protein